MQWSWLPCDGHSGGLLLEVDKELAQVVAEDQGEFFQSVKLSMTADGFEWMLFNIYGPAHDDRKREFLDELLMKVQETDLPMLLGGDFNLVRRIE